MGLVLIVIRSVLDIAFTGRRGKKTSEYIADSVPRSYMRDEGRPLGAGLQEQASNHLKLLW